MLPLQERTNLLESMLPDDPEDRQVVEYPEGQVVGASIVISVYKQDKRIGAASSVYPIVNVTRKHTANRLSSNVPIAEKDVIRIVAQQFTFNSVIFIQYFGWIGYKVIGEPLITSDKFYRVITAIPVGPKDNAEFHLYEKVCLESLEVNSDAKPTQTTP